MAYTGKESLKSVDICMCISDSLCRTPATSTTLCISYTPRKKFQIIIPHRSGSTEIQHKKRNISECVSMKKLTVFICRLLSISI